MPGYENEGRRRRARVQATGALARLGALLACCGLAGCGPDPMAKPMDLFHDLEGGQIAAQRPPPPGAGQPYPHVGTVPAKPVMPDPAFRNALRNQLASERDNKELLAADTPIDKIVVPPPLPAKQVQAGTAVGAPTPTPQSQVPQSRVAQSPTASTPPDTEPTANATLSAADAPAPAPKPATPAPDPIPSDAPLQLVGDPVDTPGLPLVPDAPPAPASFEGVPAQPAPTQRVMPVHVPPPDGTGVFFAPDAATLGQSQIQTLKDLVGRRKNQTIEIIGLGEAQSDTPEGQEDAIGLALKRAKAIADALSAMHVPQGAMRVSARPFGRGAVLRLLP